MEFSIHHLIEYYAKTSISLVNIFTTSLSNYEKDIGRKTAPNVCGIVIPLKGHAQFSLNETPYHLTTQSILHAGSSMPIEIQTFHEAFEYAVIHYKIVEAPTNFNKMENNHFPLRIGEKHLIVQYIEQLLLQQSKPDYLSKLQAQVTFLQLLEQLLVSARQANSQHDKMDAISNALQYIHQHYAKELSISELAAQFGFDRRRFSELFEQLTGLTPMHYLTEYRIRKAKLLLQTTRLPIVEIAEQVGYLDSFYFSRVFKKYVNTSPSLYRKEHGKNPYFLD